MRRSIKPDYYKDEKGEWRWKLTARNHRRIHSATEGFSSKQGARRNFELIIDVGLAMAPAALTEDLPILE
jgi:uncharacterized protein YegP (UPF0339 family)